MALGGGVGGRDEAASIVGALQTEGAKFGPWLSNR